MDRGSGAVALCVLAVFFVLAPVFLARGCAPRNQHTADLVEGRR